MKVRCLVCQKEFETIPSRVKHGGGKYCSRTCRDKSMSKRITCVCLFCHKNFSVIPSVVKKGFGKYCSSDCYHSACTGTKRRSRQVLRTCVVCGKKFMAYPSRVLNGRAKCCSRDCVIKLSFGRKVDEKTKEKIRKANKGREMSTALRLKLSLTQKGENNSNWKNGATPLNKLIRSSMIYRQWQNAVFKRDCYTCLKCGQKYGQLNGHHICGFSEFSELRFDMDNGITFCKKCHDGFHALFGKKHNASQQVVSYLELN